MESIDEIMRLIIPLLKSNFTLKLKKYVKSTFPKLSKDDIEKIQKLANEEFKDSILEVRSAIELEMDNAADNIERAIEIEFWDTFPDSEKDKDSLWDSTSDDESVGLDTVVELGHKAGETLKTFTEQILCNCSHDEPKIEDDLKEKIGIQTHIVAYNWDEI